MRSHLRLGGGFLSDRNLDQAHVPTCADRFLVSEPEGALPDLRNKYVDQPACRASPSKAQPGNVHVGLQHAPSSEPSSGEASRCPPAAQVCAANNCKKTFLPVRSDQKTCSNKCGRPPDAGVSGARPADGIITDSHRQSCSPPHRAFEILTTVPIVEIPGRRHHRLFTLQWSCPRSPAVPSAIF